jgi:hypothetical protein
MSVSSCEYGAEALVRASCAAWSDFCLECAAKGGATYSILSINGAIGSSSSY